MKIQKILVSQPKPTSEKSPYYDLEGKYGVKIEFRPFIKIEGISSREFRQTKVPIGAHTAVILTARAAVDNYFRLSNELRHPIPDTMKYFCINEQIANYLQKYIVYRKRKIFFGDGTPEDLVTLINKHNKERYLYPQSEVLEKKLQGIDARKVVLQPSIMYRTVSNCYEEGTKLDYDMIILFTPSGVKAMLENFPHFEQGDIAIGAMGTKTIDAVKNAGLRLDVTTSPEAPSMAAAIAQYLKEHKGDKGGTRPENIAVTPVIERKPLPVLLNDPQPEPKKRGRKTATKRGKSTTTRGTKTTKATTKTAAAKTARAKKTAEPVTEKD